LIRYQLAIGRARGALLRRQAKFPVLAWLLIFRTVGAAGGFLVASVGRWIFGS